MVLACLNTSQWTAVAAIASAVAAGVALATVFLSRGAVAEARRAADAAERSTLLQSVPIVFGMEADAIGGFTDLMLVAVGHGVAFNISAEVRQDGLSLGRTLLISHLESGEPSGSLPLTPSLGGVDPDRPYEVETTYRDAAGTEYLTLRESLLRGEGRLTKFQYRSDPSLPWQSPLSQTSER